MGKRTCVGLQVRQIGAHLESRMPAKLHVCPAPGGVAMERAQAKDGTLAARDGSTREHERCMEVFDGWPGELEMASRSMMFHRAKGRHAQHLYSLTEN